MRRLTLALATAGGLAAVAGAGDPSFYLLLGAVPVAAGAALEAVCRVVDEESSRAPAILAGLAVLLVVAAASTRTPEVAFGCLALALVEATLRLPRASVGIARPPAAG